ncbi:MAG: hypothetical protein A2293_10340 [Elusimicrobia bacterium RIFOXYB2_FULL_49_7]|nr:MAG: hypothetical protein A2293_10340 [Elusimicrobia bacterium RIFOXYB2_FULL_49_7]
MTTHSKGFTLIELLIGITVLVMVITTVYASYQIGSKTYKKIDSKSNMNQNMRQGWRQISRDLRCAYISSSSKDIVFVGKHAKEGETVSDRVDFVTYLPFTDAKSRSGGLAKVSYYIDIDPQTPHEGLIKEYRELPVADAAKIQEIAPLATSFGLRYFDGIEWKETWGLDDSNEISNQANRLPLSVEIQVKLRGNDNTEQTILTTVPVMCK